MNRVFVGVDTGISGAAVAVSQRRQVLDCMKFKKDEYSFLDGWLLYERLLEWMEYGALTVWMEHAQARPTDARNRAFAFGKYYGAQREAVRFASQLHEDIVLQIVRPQVWKEAMGLTGKGKEASIELVRQLIGLDTRNHNIAEAGLIAAYGISRTET